MIADNMPFRFHSFDQIFVFRNEISNHKKCSRCLMFFQCIQNSRSISIFKACVKGEIDFLFFGIFSKKGIVLSQFFYRCISNRTFAFFLKTESPVGTLGRSSSLSGSVVRYDFSYRGTYKCTSTEKKKNLGKSGRENPSGRYVFEMHREY